MGESEKAAAVSLAMKVRRLKCVTLTFLVLNLLSIYLLWRYLSGSDRPYYDRQDLLRRPQLSQLKAWSRDSNMSVAEFVTVVIYDFEDFDNDVPATVRSFLSSMPTLRVLVVTEKYPYPPLKLHNSTNVRLVTTDPQLTSRFRDLDPISYIKTRYVAIVPDSTRLDAGYQLKQMLHELDNSVSAVAARFPGTSTKCMLLKVSVRRWTLEYSYRASDFRKCDAIADRHVVMMETRLLADLAQPFLRPFPEALYLQTAVRRVKVQLLKSVVFQPGRQLFMDSHLRWKHEQLLPARLANLYRQMGMKRVVRNSGDGDGEGVEEDWFGCRRDTPRCFPTVLNDTPNYLHLGRWTPPCCLEGLRQTARHVMQTLDDSGVRYWLEGGSLLGAVRTGDIIPWDYDVDLGMYADDISKCKPLQEARRKSPAEDASGFVWEKAKEGDFFRVHYSHINRLHVDIFPFRSSGGIMTKDTWILGHPQDMEFPERFLKPLERLEFVGVDASVPNNARDFLELKFGKGVIEHPQYPNPAALKGGSERRP